MNDCPVSFIFYDFVCDFVPLVATVYMAFDNCSIYIIDIFQFFFDFSFYRPKNKIRAYEYSCQTCYTATAWFSPEVQKCKVLAENLTFDWSFLD